MAFQPETAAYDGGVLQLETTTPVQGGVGGAANSPLLSLSNRTTWLKAQVDALNTNAANKANLNSPIFTGDPTAPTAASGDNDTSIANTAFVQNAVGGAATINMAGGANVTATVAQAGAAILLLTGAITANVALIVPTAVDKWVVHNGTTGAFTVTVKTAAGAGVVLDQTLAYQVFCDGVDVKASTVAAVATAAQFDSSSRPASTSFLKNALGNIRGVVGVTSGAGTTVTLTAANFGTLVALTGAASFNVAMPTASTDGSAVAFYNAGSATITLLRAGADLFYFGDVVGTGGGKISMSIRAGDTVYLVANGAIWYAIGGSAALVESGLFRSSLSGTTGWQRLPSGLILQWGQVSYSAGSGSATFPIAFPSVIAAIVLGQSDAVTGPNASVSAKSLTSFSVVDTDTTANSADYLAIGF